MQGQLVERIGTQDGCVYRLKPVTTTIGRADDNDIVLADVHVSHHHAEVRCDGEQFVLHDLGSRNGTFVNDQKLAGPQPLRQGDCLLIGEVRLAFQTTIPSDATVYWQSSAAAIQAPGQPEHEAHLALEPVQIEINEEERARQVAELTDNEYFRQLKDRALEQHRRRSAHG